MVLYWCQVQQSRGPFNIQAMQQTFPHSYYPPMKRNNNTYFKTQNVYLHVFFPLLQISNVPYLLNYKSLLFSPHSEPMRLIQRCILYMYISKIIENFNGVGLYEVAPCIDLWRLLFMQSNLNILMQHVWNIEGRFCWFKMQSGFALFFQLDALAHRRTCKESASLLQWGQHVSRNYAI